MCGKFAKAMASCSLRKSNTMKVNIRLIILCIFDQTNKTICFTNLSYRYNVRILYTMGASSSKTYHNRRGSSSHAHKANTEKNCTRRARPHYRGGLGTPPSRTHSVTPSVTSVATLVKRDPHSGKTPMQMSALYAKQKREAAEKKKKRG